MNILISGGTGNVGKILIPLIKQSGHECYILTRSPKSKNDIFWNPTTGEGELPDGIEMNAVVHLAGYSVSNKWTKKNKQEMVDSRLQSTQLLKKMLLAKKSENITWIQASAIGIYNNTQEWQDETSAHGKGFLAQLTFDWEQAIFEHPKSWRKVTLRIGVVMDKASGALPAMMPVFKLGLGSGLGSGKQWMSWIGIEDLARMILFAINNNNLQGTYNAVAPVPVDNNAFSKLLSQSLKRPFWLPNVPAFVLKLLVGEMASMVLNSQRISSKKIQEAGFEFKYKTLDQQFQAIFS
jgi:uncharacterized protein (TIGR01777 family)